jgi:hypothetical protein
MNKKFIIAAITFIIILYLISLYVIGYNLIVGDIAPSPFSFIKEIK